MTTAPNIGYKAIKATVLDRIQNGIWRPDQILPSEADLAQEFATTRTTVNRAMRELADEGYLERKRKAGTRVLKSPLRQARFAISLIKDEILATGAAYRYSLVSSTEITAPDWLRSRLDLSKNQRVMHIQCVHYADTKPFQFEDRWIVIDSVPQVRDASFETAGPNGWLIETVPFTNVELTFLANRADPKTADLLSIPSGEAVFTEERTTWLQDQPVTFARLHFHAGYRMTTRL